MSKKQDPDLMKYEAEKLQALQVAIGAVRHAQQQLELEVWERLMFTQNLWSHRKVEEAQILLDSALREMEYEVKILKRKLAAPS